MMHKLQPSMYTARFNVGQPLSHSHMHREGFQCSRLAIGLHGGRLESWYAIARVQCWQCS